MKAAVLSITLFVAALAALFCGVSTTRAQTAPGDGNDTNGVVSRYWQTGPILDQGDTPECVGYSLETLMEDGPLAWPAGTFPSADWLYFGAQARDPWSNEAHDGSTIEAGFAYLEDYGYVDSVSYTSDVEQVAQWVLNDGPVEMASEWDWLMFNPSATGVVTPGGLIAGYHAWVIDGYDTVTQMFDAQTSWGDSFGNGGHFLISKDSVWYLLNNEASQYKEAALPHKDMARWEQGLFMARY